MSDPEDRRYFFIHVMKTAGTTLARHLKQQFPNASIYPSRGYDWEEVGDVEPYASIPRLLALAPERRAEIRMYTGHFPFWVSERIDPDLFTLTVLREPVDRTVSVLKHFKRLDQRFRTSDLEAIYDDETIQAYWIRNHQTKVFSLLPTDEAVTIMRPITVDDERFELAKQNLASVDILGLTESFTDLLDELQQKRGWWPGGIDRDDRTNASPEAWDVSPELRLRIADENPYDIELYRFAQELIARRRS